ncbi:MAG: hypothetical protein V4481_00890 [Patescibacteria group bacterium]
MLDYSKKVLHIGICSNQTKEEGVTVHQGLIFSPPAVFSKVNTHAEDIFAEFFLPQHQYRLTCLITEMGPGELVRVFDKKIGVIHSLTIGGMVAPFAVQPAKLERLWNLVTTKQHKLVTSREKKAFANQQISGVKVVN